MSNQKPPVSKTKIVKVDLGRTTNKPSNTLKPKQSNPKK